MSHSMFKVQGMTCQHCVKAIEKRVAKLEGVDTVAVNLANSQVDVQFDDQKISLDGIRAAIVDEGYHVIN